ncbi:MAG: hypothetical protein U0002_03235 [Thermoanaerobaculia bacterium]
MREIATLVGSAGVGLLLVAFFAGLRGWLPSKGFAYLALNLAGGALACYSSWLIGFLPFVVLEGTWTLVAAAGLFEWQRSRGRAKRAARG